jgi:hypothetical protein
MARSDVTDFHAFIVSVAIKSASFETMILRRVLRQQKGAAARV